MPRVWVVLFNYENSDPEFDFIENMKVAEVDVDDLAEYEETGYIKTYKEYTGLELLESVELQN
jgi:hypothetical protein